MPNVLPGLGRICRCLRPDPDNRNRSHTWKVRLVPMASIVSASAAVVNSARNQASAGGCASPMPACRHQSDALTGLRHSILLVAWGAAGSAHT